MEKVKSHVMGDPHRQGDGRVPLASARLEYVKEVRYVKGVHDKLPMVPVVYEDVFRWLKGQPMQLHTTEQAALSSSLSGGILESQYPNLTSVVPTDPVLGDPGYLNFDGPSAEELQELMNDFNRNPEAYPEFNRSSIL